MDGHDWAARPPLAFVLPPELLLAVFDYCDREDVIRAARVSSAWRIVASSHELYYARISVLGVGVYNASSIKDAISLFARRIAAATTQGMRFAVDVAVDYSSSFLASDSTAEPLDASLHKAIIAALPHTISLSLAVPVRLFNLINDTSPLHPAPMLQRLEIRLAYSSKTTPLNNDIFAGTCPTLQDVYLSRVPLLDRGYPAFQSATRIELGRRPVYRFSTISQVFPRAQRLNMILDSLYGDSPSPPPQHVPVRPLHLARLRIWTTLNILPPEFMAVLSASPPIADVEIDWWSGMQSDSHGAAPEYMSISEYLQNMNGPLDLSVFSIEGAGYSTDTVLRDLNSGVTRTFREPQLLESDSESNRRAMRGQDIVTYNFTAERFRPGLSMIVALHIEPLFWNEIDYLTRRLPALQLVELLVDNCPRRDSIVNVDRWMNQDDHFPVSPTARVESCRVVELKITAKPETPGLKIRALTILRLIRQCHLLGPDVRARVTLENVCRIPCEYDDVLGSVVGS